ncbi:MAG: SDR family NAD(P)-dependent oxidoreductase [Streptosporangiaceae bacterium]|jgi:NAD(P)-dependent dehydrogenase (short-subunit alcohol dehydrogenase family)
MSELAGRVAVVTGGAGGVGGAIARRLAESGARVAIWDRDESGAQRVADGLKTATAVGCDVSVEESVAEALQRTRTELGVPSVLVTAAGIMNIAPFLDTSLRDWSAELDVNLTGTFLCVRACAKLMIETGTGGSMVCVSSVAGRGPRPDAPAYAASKAGVISVVRSAALAFASHGITVNAVCPGVVDTEMTRRNAQQRAQLTGTTTRAAMGRLVATVPLGRMQTPDDVADVVMFFLSSSGGYVTGQALNACGGLEFG